jgi:hypothetical protein
LQPPPKRTVRESHKFEEELKAAIVKYPRIEDAWVGISWLLSRGPQEGAAIGNGHYLMKFVSYLELDVKVPGITILYRFDDEFVDIHSLKLGEEE